MLVIPAIDLKDGQCVRLKQGRMDEVTVYDPDPVGRPGRAHRHGCRRTGPAPEVGRVPSSSPAAPPGPAPERCHRRFAGEAS